MKTFVIFALDVQSIVGIRTQDLTTRVKSSPDLAMLSLAVNKPHQYCIGLGKFRMKNLL